MINLREMWRKETVLSKCLILSCLILILFAYLPTLQFDYVMQDQWRTFRYAILEQTIPERAYACFQTVYRSYIFTGRPLVWSECIEHTFATRISDLFYFRPIVLAVVLFTAVYLGAALARYVGGWAIGTVAGAVFVMTPGYSFMYLQSITALMVLISVLLAVESFVQLTRWLDAWELGDADRRGPLYLAVLFFFLGCLMYPAYAFSVVGLAVIAFIFDRERTPEDRLKRLAATLAAYFVGAILYYLFVKISVKILLVSTGLPPPDLGGYEVTMQLSPLTLYHRVLTVFSGLNSQPLFNLSTPRYGFSVLVAALSFASAWQASKGQSNRALRTVCYAVAFMAICLVIIVGSNAPWLFSKMVGLSTRHILPFYLFMCAGSAGLVWLLAGMLRPSWRRLAPVAMVLVVLLPAATTQNKYSFLEAAASDVEIEAMRLGFGHWLDAKGYLYQRYVLIVLPLPASRPPFIERIVANTRGIGDNAYMSTSQNPVSLPWMVNAILRERKDHPIGKTVDMVTCFFDEACLKQNLATDKVVVMLTRGDKPIRVAQTPYVINLSELTSRPVQPIAGEVAATLPIVTASSQSWDLGPQGLFLTRPPGWHAEAHPVYPQTLTVDLLEAREFHEIGFLPQDIYADRMPKAVRIEISEDGDKWSPVANFANVCVLNAQGGWHSETLPAAVKTRYLRIEILSNCGSDWLTLRGLRVQ